MSLLPGKFYLDDFFNDGFSLMPSAKGLDMKCDIYEKDGNVNIEIDVPGLKKENIKIDVEDGILTVEASKKQESEEKDKNYFRKERSYGMVKRQFNVGNISEEDITAKFNDGVLSISFPKEEPKQNKKFIEIK